MMEPSLWSFKGEVDFGDHLVVPEFKVHLQRCLENQDEFVKFYRGLTLVAEWTFHEYAVRSVACVKSLPLDLSKQNRVMVISDNSPELLLAYGSLLAAGSMVFPFGTDEKPRYYSDLMELIDPDLVLISSESGLKDGIRKLLGASYRCELLDLDKPCRQSCSVREAEQTLSEVCSQKAEMVFFTSGTTSLPKGVMLPWATSQINAEATVRTHNMNPQHVHYSPLPLVHVNAFHFSYLSCLTSQSRLILSHEFDLQVIYKLLDKERPNVVSAVPTILQFLNMDPRQVSLPDSINYFVTAAAPLSPKTLDQFYEKFSVPVIQSYGLSEAVNFTLVNDPFQDRGEWEKTMLYQKELPAGMPIWGNEVRVVDDGGRDLMDNEVGEVLVRGWNVMAGYFENDESTRTVFEGGWLHTGDLGYFKAINNHSKLVYLKGRIKEIIKRSGQNISIQELEYRITPLFVRNDFAVVGFANDWTGEEVGLVLAADFSDSEIEKFSSQLGKILPFEKVPKVIVRGVEIQRTRTGKIQRAKMAGLFDSWKETKFLRSQFGRS